MCVVGCIPPSDFSSLAAASAALTLRQLSPALLHLSAPTTLHGPGFLLFILQSNMTTRQGTPLCLRHTPHSTNSHWCGKRGLQRATPPPSRATSHPASSTQPPAYGYSHPQRTLTPSTVSEASTTPEFSKERDPALSLHLQIKPPFLLKEAHQGSSPKSRSLSTKNCAFLQPQTRADSLSP